MRQELPLIGEESRHWMDKALCQYAPNPDELFFPREGDANGAIRKAREYCDPCPVRLKCLEDAMTWESTTGWSGHRHGIYGGLTPNQRHALHKQRKADAA